MSALCLRSSMRVAVVLCIVFAACAFGKNVKPEDLPPPMSIEKIKDLKEGLENGTVSCL